MAKKSTLYSEIQKKTLFYVRKGGKKNRRQQAARMIAFARFCENKGAKSVGQIGKTHIELYFRSIAHLSESTRMQHYYAIKTLWHELLEKPTEIPKLKTNLASHQT